MTMTVAASHLLQRRHLAYYLSACLSFPSGGDGSHHLQASRLHNGSLSLLATLCSISTWAALLPGGLGAIGIPIPWGHHLPGLHRCGHPISFSGGLGSLYLPLSGPGGTFLFLMPSIATVLGLLLFLFRVSTAMAFLFQAGWHQQPLPSSFRSGWDCLRRSCSPSSFGYTSASA